MTTPNLGLAEWNFQQSHANVPVNLTFRLLDALVGGVATNAAPSPPADGDTYLTSTGLAVRYNEQWYELAGRRGMILWNEDDAEFQTWNGAAWVPLPGGGGGGQVDSILGANGILIDDTDPTEPIVYVDPNAIAFTESLGAYTQIAVGNSTDNPDIIAYSGAIQGRLGSYTWLQCDSDGAAASNGSYIDLKSDVYSEFLARSYADNDYGPTFTVYKSRGTQAAPTQALSGDFLGGFYWGARHNSAGWHFPATLLFQLDANCTAIGGAPGWLSIWMGTTSPSSVERLKFHTDGRVQLGDDTGLTFDEYGSAPATPASAKVILYAKADGNLYQKDDAGVETKLSGSAVDFSRGATWVAGSGALATPTNKVFVRIPIAATIRRVTLLTAGGTGSCVVDIDKSTYAGFPTMTSICASAKPTISSGTKYEDATLTGWTTSVSAGDVLGFELESTSTFTYISVQVDLEPA